MTRFHVPPLLVLATAACLHADDTKPGTAREIVGIKVYWCPTGKFMMGRR